EPDLVERVEAGAGGELLRDRGVDRARRQPGRERATGEHGALARRLGEVALVRDPDHLVAGAEREEDLGRVRDERDDPQAPSSATSSTSHSAASPTAISPSSSSSP